MKIATGLIGLILIGAVGPAGAAPPQVAVCAACHGANGMGNAGAGLPALAGLPAPYLLQAAACKLQAGHAQKSSMTAQAASLDAAQRQTIAAYYAAMTVPQAPDQPAAGRRRG